MNYREFKPSDRLKQHIKCFYVYESSRENTFDDTVYPSGHMEIIFNMGSGRWQIPDGNRFVNTPSVELWGQLIRPLAVRSVGKNTMLGVRFFPHAAACFLDDKIDVFNNQIADLNTVLKQDIDSFHLQLLEKDAWHTRISMLESFLYTMLSANEKRTSRIAVVNDIMLEIKKDNFFDNLENVALRYGISARYLQKLFLQYTGLTPKLYSKINRFQHSLALVTSGEASLTSIAYDCGYFDQSHFIRDFKAFTGITPSGFVRETSPITVALVAA